MKRIAKLKLKESVSANEFNQLSEDSFVVTTYFFTTSIKWYSKISKSNQGMEEADGYFILPKTEVRKTTITIDDRIKVDNEIYKINDIIPLSSNHFKVFFEKFNYNSGSVVIEGEAL